MNINVEIKEVTIQSVRDWLLAYAWSGTMDEQERNVECIMSQEGVLEVVDGLTEKYAGQANNDAQKLLAQGYALSSLYECHDEPHLKTCPYGIDEGV